MKKMFRIMLPVVLLAAGAVGAWHLTATRPTLEPAPSTEKVWPVDAIEVHFADVRPSIHLFGTIHAAREVQLRALVPGQVVDVHPNLVEGGTIRAGESILTIDEFEYHSALQESEAVLAEAEALLVGLEASQLAEMRAMQHDQEILALLERDLERAEQLSIRGHISSQALDQKRLETSRQQRAVTLRQNAIDTASARLVQQREVIKRLAVAVRRARYDLERVRLQAPFGGVFWGIGAQVGQRLSVNDRIGSLIDTGRLEVRFHVSDAQYGRLIGTEQGIVGRSAQVIWQVGQARTVLDAIVERVGAQIDAATGGVELFARIMDGESASHLRPGAFVDVVIPDRSYADVARVPETVPHPGDIAYAVVDGRLVPRPIEIVARVGKDVLLQGDITEGELLVTTQSAMIAPGLRVEIR